MKMLAKLKVGKPGAAFLFPGSWAGFIDPDMFDAEVWKPIAIRAEMAGTRYHDLRHFFASQLIANGGTATYYALCPAAKRPGIRDLAPWNANQHTAKHN